MAKAHVCVIEDEEDIAELIRYNLQKSGYGVEAAHTGEEGLEKVRLRKPDLVLLDLMLPGMDGLEICRRLRQEPATERIPVIMVTAKGEEEDIVRGLELGADDYVTKPFSPSVLLARVQAVLRRTRDPEVARADGDRLEIDGITIDRGKHEVWADGNKLELTLSEFLILDFLARKPGWVFTRNQIVKGIRGSNYSVTLRAIDVSVVGLRKKLGASAEWIETVRGVGYRFKED